MADATVSRVDSDRKVSPGQLVLLLLLWVGLPVVLVALKQTGLPLGAFLRRHDSLISLPSGVHQVVGNVLLVPLGALIIVFFRLTLGLRVLGPFRSILLAFAFLSTGILVGLVFFAATVGILVVTRPVVRDLRLPYFGRVSVMLSLVSLLVILSTLTGVWIGSAALRGVAHFPIVVLCLIGEAVAKAMRTDGVAVGIWRASMTAVGAVVVTAVVSIVGLRGLLLRYPELMLVETTAVALVAHFCAWRLLGRLNPEPHPALRRQPAAVNG